MFNFDFLEFGQRLYAQKKWWLRVKHLRDGFYLVIDGNTIMPCQVLLLKQSEEDALYQKILFKKF